MPDLMEEYQRFKQSLGELDGRSIENLEAMAHREYEDIVRIFVDESGDVTKKYSGAEKVVVWLEDKISHTNTAEKAINTRIIDQRIDRKLFEVNEKCSQTRKKLSFSERAYDLYLQQVTALKIACVEYADFSERFQIELEQGRRKYAELKENLDKDLHGKNLAGAKQKQKELIQIDRQLREFEKEKNDCAIKTVASFRELKLAHANYLRARVFTDVLRKTSVVLDQLRDYVRGRVEDYRKAGNFMDLAEYQHLRQEMESTKQTLDEHFRTGFPLLKHAEATFQSLGPNNSYGGILSVKDEMDESVYNQALQVRREAMDLSI